MVLPLLIHLYVAIVVRMSSLSWSRDVGAWPWAVCRVPELRQGAQRKKPNAGKFSYILYIYIYLSVTVS